MFRVPSCVLLLTTLLSSVAAAQSPDSLTPGEAVRVVHRCSVTNDQVIACRDNFFPQVLGGQLQAFDADTIHVRPNDGGADLAIPMAFVSQVWVKDGTRSNFWAGAGIGMLGGALLGGIIGSQMEWCMLWSCSPATGIGVGVGTTVGFLIGGIAGSATHSDRWRAVRSEGLHLSFVPAPDGLRLAASVSF